MIRGVHPRRETTYVVSLKFQRRKKSLEILYNATATIKEFIALWHDDDDDEIAYFTVR